MKKGLNALAASLLLLFAAIVIGIALISFGRSAIESQAECSIDVNMKIVNINNQSQVCYDENKLFFLVENGDIIDVNSLKVRAIDVNRKIFETNVKNSYIPKTGSFRFNQSNMLGKILQIRITPVIKLYNQEIVCVDKSLIIDKPKPCNEIF